MGGTSATLRHEVINDLTKETKFTHSEVCDLYRQFKMDCKSKSYMTQDDFKEMYWKMFPHGDSSKFASVIFRSFDKENKGKVDFRHFIIILSKPLKGSVRERLEWLFDVYDIKKDGKISRDDITEMVQCLSLLNAGILPPGHGITDTQLADFMFETADLNSQGYISREKFATAATSSVTIKKMLNNTAMAASCPYESRKERSGSFGRPRSQSSLSLRSHSNSVISDVF